MGRCANLLGATALAVHDRALAGGTRAAGVGLSAGAALVVLSDTAGLGVTELGRRIGLSQPATARMVDSLDAAGLTVRRARSGRSVTVALTPIGRAAATEVLAERHQPLTDLLGALEPAEHRVLEGLLSKLLARAYATVGNADLLCRLCDRAGCVAGAVCPVGQAERDRGR